MVMISTPSCYAQAPSTITCPKSASISPCACKQYIGNGFPAFNNSIKIDCKGKNLGDSQISRVLNAFLAPGLSPIKEISASYNQITKVPKEVSKFPALLLVDFGSNRISEIPYNNGKPFIKNDPSTNEFIWISFVGNQIRHINSFGRLSFPLCHLCHCRFYGKSNRYGLSKCISIPFGETYYSNIL